MHWQPLEDDLAAGALAAALAVLLRVDLLPAVHLVVPHLVVPHPAAAIPADHPAMPLAEAAPSLIHSLPLFSY